ncbi:hypothetical protein KC316_g10922 [Hortaea werneckii]|nr:hypothetical protein KC324_g7545 [Hortaea werneckii]KAI7575834.1 hypothetical protein KC316_g10922 [Hortaea werneckii]
MGQYWEIINIDHRHVLLNHQGLKLPEILHNRIPEMLVDLMKVPPLKNLRFASAAVGGARSRAIARNEGCRLLALPQEILDGITPYIQEALDVLCLALSHSYFFRILADRVRAAVIADEAPWAGDYATSVPSSVTASDVQQHFITIPGMEYEDDDPSEAQRSFRARNPLYSMEEMTVSDAVVPVDWAKALERIEALKAPRGWERMRSEEVGSGVRRARATRLTREGDGKAGSASSSCHTFSLVVVRFRFRFRFFANISI